MICYDLDNIKFPSYDDNHINADKTIIDLLCILIEKQKETIAQHKITNLILMESYEHEVDIDDIER